ncbi:hypothetical protein [Lysobacter tyrosinilyticus]
MSRNAKKLVATASLVMALAAGSSAVQATGIPVVDVANVLQATLNQINTYSARFQDVAEYSEQLMRWKRTLEQYQQQLIQIQGVVMSFGLPQGQPITKVPPNYMVAERCGGGFNLSNLTQVFQINPTGNIIEQQKQVCANIQQMENAKFNYTVDFFNEYMPKLQSELKQSETRRNSSNNQGNVAAADNDALRINNTADANFQTWQANIQAYDSYIAGMENNQRLLAKAAMKGKESLLGTMIKTTALKGALEVGN